MGQASSLCCNPSPGTNQVCHVSNIKSKRQQLHNRSALNSSSPRHNMGLLLDPCKKPGCSGRCVRLIHTSWDRPLSWELGKTQAANLQMRLVPRGSAVWLIQLLRASNPFEPKKCFVVSGQLIRGKLGYQEIFENIIMIIIFFHIIIIVIIIIIDITYIIIFCISYIRSYESYLYTWATHITIVLIAD